MEQKISVRNRFKNLITWFSVVPGKVTDKLLLLQSKLPKPLQSAITVSKDTVTFFRSHATGTLGAGLSYYMLFSIAPIMVIIVSVAGVILGPDAVSGALQHQIQSVMGASTAKQLQDMVKGAYQPGKNWIGTTLSAALLFFGALGVFDELRDSLNIIWDVPPVAKKKFLNYFVNRLFSIGMLLCMAFLLLVSLVIEAGLSAFSSYLSTNLSGISKILLAALEFTLSFGLSTMLFAFIYKFMSDVKIKLRLVWPGALFTAALFAVGKYLIGLYISTSRIANTYGAASSMIVLLLWVFYSSQIVFIGAEFTRALALHRGINLTPEVKKEQSDSL